MPYKYQSDATAHMRRYRAENRELTNEIAARSREKHREAIRIRAQEYRRANPELTNRHARESYWRNVEAQREAARKYWWAHRDRLLLQDDMRRADPVFKQRATNKAKRWRVYCKACRNELRALVREFPTVVKYIDIDIERATDGQVRYFYDKLMEDLRNGHYQYTRKRKG